mmetsp:Transcript_3559/g.14799  ORF Transcript_3559/g.14799 Transcript_3559/m.14799 type:complete len:271 (+) Transcript_3559:832-1644(+)
MTGSCGSSSLMKESARQPWVTVVPTVSGSPPSSPVAQRAPSMKSPWQNMPFSGYSSASLGSNMAVMCVSTLMLSSARPVCRAVTCMIAVRKAIGLNSPGSHMLRGVTRSVVQTDSCSTRRCKSRFHEVRFFAEGQASASQLVLWKGLRPGTWLIERASVRCSIASVMFSSPLSPFCSSTSDVRILVSSLFMRSHSWMATSTYGALCSARSGSAVASMSMRTKLSGIVSSSDATMPPTPPLPPPSPPPSSATPVPDRERMVAKSDSALEVR